MENYIDIQYITNLVNFGYANDVKILQLETIKTKILLLLSCNDIVTYDTKSTRKATHHYNNPITAIKVHKEKLFLISGTKLIWVNQDTLEEQSNFDLKEDFYLISFFDKQHLEAIYANTQNEIKYIAKGLINESIIKNLYKENEKIHKLVYQNNILLWITSTTMKVFHLSKRKMLIKKIFNGYQKKVDCLLYSNILCLNVNMKEIFVFRLPNEDNDIPYPIELVNLKEEKENRYFIGMWMNSSLNKLSVLYSENSYVKLKIMRVNINSSNSVSQFYFEKRYPSIVSYGEDLFTFVFSSTVFLFSAQEIYFVNLLEKREKLFRDVQGDNQSISQENLDIIYDIFDRCDLNEKFYLLCKIVLNESMTMMNREIKTIGGMEADKFYYLYNSLFNSENNREKNYEKNIKILFTNFIFTLIKYSKFELLYEEIKNKFNSTLSQISKERIIQVLLYKKKYEILLKFVNDVTEIELTSSIERLFYRYLKENDNPKEAVFIFAQINSKNKRFNTALSYYISISNIDEIFHILTSGNQELLFNYDKLYELLDESKLLTVLDLIYYKKSSLCDIFYQRFFKFCNDKKISIFTMYLVAYDKLRLIPNISTGEKLFKILLENSNSLPSKVSMSAVNILQKFIENYERFDYQKLIDENKSLLSQKHNYEIYILLLTHTKNYKDIINIYIDTIQNPEQCIKFIENTNIEDITKEEIYDYLKAKIKETKSLSNVKKFYFISQFQDDMTLLDPNCLQLLENLSDETDNIKYIVYILEQLKLKVNILDISKSVSQNNMKEFMESRKMEKVQGKKISFESENFSCEYDNCELNKKFDKDDTIITFKHCLHLFHKDCIVKYYSLYGSSIKNAKTFECPICSHCV